jgi:protease II
MILLHTKMRSGHFGVSGRYNHLYDVAMEHAFIIYMLGGEEALS